MDLTPWLHATIAAALQVAVALLMGNWWLGGALACIWWMAREHTQAEYRWIEQFGDGKRINMPQWGGLDPRVWNLASVLDWLVPVAVCCVCYLLLRQK